MNKILICGDLYDNGNLSFTNELILLMKSSHVIVNLEAPIIEFDKIPIEKNGPNLSHSFSIIKKMKDIGVKYCNLSNNHICDYGERGLKSTLDSLTNNDIVPFGYHIKNKTVGMVTFDINKKKIAVISYSDLEFNNINGSGAIIFGLSKVKRDIERIKKNFDFVIVLYHGGKEHFSIPSPNLKETCRYIIDVGADLVLCQHSHIIGLIEKYKGKEICYGQGNFATSLTNNRNHEDGLIYELTVKSNNIEINKYLSSNIADVIQLNDLNKYNNVFPKIDLENDKALLLLFKKNLDKEKSYYIDTLLGFGFFRKRIFRNKSSFLFQRIYKKRIIKLLNLIRSDTLREVSICILEEFEGFKSE